MKGKELTEGWAELQAKVRAGDFVGIHEGDYKPVALTTGEVVNMVVDSIHPHKDCDDMKIDRHIVFVPMDSMTKETILEGMRQRFIDEAGRPPKQFVGRLALPV